MCLRVNSRAVMILKFLFSLLLAGVCVTASPITFHRENLYDGVKTDDEPSGQTIYRLPNNIVPNEYDLKIIPTLNPDFKFTGVVTIKIFVGSTATGNKIMLHSKDLTIEKVELSKGRPIETKPPQLDEKNELLVIELTDQQLATNSEYELAITFNGKLKDDMKGFYRSWYKEDGAVKWLAATQFEATDARKAFPCFDEPKFRARFTIHIAKLPNELAASNMPIDISPVDPPIVYPSAPGREWVKFQKTNSMATYLVAYIVGEIFKTSYDKDSSISLWTRKKMIDNGKYILKKSSSLLKALEDFTGVKYNLPKLDLAAIPDFKAGAMENWGLTTYREKYVLADEKTSSQNNLQAITQVVAHEFSHQWFGDYVTPEWWNYLWLNEAFATYFEYHIPAEVESKWRFKEWFVVDVVQEALFSEPFYDHPMTASVQTVPEIDSLFDLVTYDKGGSVLRMLEHTITTKTFKKALQYYLTDGHNSGGIVTPAKFFEALEVQMYQEKMELLKDTKITDIMKTWTENVGYPLVTATRNKEGICTITQQTYTTPRADKPRVDQEWIIPISYTTSSKKQFEQTQPTVLSFAKKDLSLTDKLQPNEWILVNIQQTGYYRVNYDEENWNLLTNQLLSSPTVIHQINRAQLVDDAFSLALDEKIKYDIPLKLATYLKTETDMLPLFPAIKHFNNLYNLYQETPLKAKIEEYLRDILTPHFKRLGGFSEGPIDENLVKTGRAPLLMLACAVGLKECVDGANDLYKKNEAELQNVPANVKGVVYCNALRHSKDKSVWNKLWALYENTELAYDKDIILQAFACTEDPSLLKEYLEELMKTDVSTKKIRLQDHRYVLRSISSLLTGITAAINFISDKLKDTSKLDTNGVETLQNIAHSFRFKAHTADHLSLLSKLQENAEKLDEKTYGSLAKTIKGAYEKCSAKKELKQKRSEELKAAVDNTLPSGDTKSNSSYFLRAPSILLYLTLVCITIFTNIPK